MSFGNACEALSTASTASTASTHAAPSADAAWRELMLDVGHGHRLSVRCHGHARGIPVLLLHGGPGSGQSPLLRSFFVDAQRWHLICVDQRGAGASTPRGGTNHNTTDDLLADLEAVRRALGVPRWLVVGGSWGATVAVAHAAHSPDAVLGLLLRSSFLARAEDIDWFFQGAAAEEPEAWAQLAASVAGDGDRSSLLRACASMLQGGGTTIDESARRCAVAWWRWEQALGRSSNVTPPTQPQAALPDERTLEALVHRYRVQSHYLLNQCFLEADPLLQRCERVPPVPTLLLHGREDRVCRLEGAAALQRALPHATLHVVDGAGHDPTHPGMRRAMQDALTTFADHSRFVATP
jgi:proline iminopeptidase